MADLSGTFGPWWGEVMARGRFAKAVVTGPRRSGKSEWFRRLAAEPGSPVVLWDVLPSARLRDADDVWRALWDLVGAEPPASRQPEDRLDAVLDSRDRDLVLVVDRWDEAIDARGVTVADACYEVLDALMRYCIGQSGERDDSQPHLQLVLISRLPAAEDLEAFARAVQRPTFERLSLFVVRNFDNIRFPFLRQEDAVAVLAEKGVGAEAADRAARWSGGWLWLLDEAAGAVAASGRWDTVVQNHLERVRVPLALEAATFSLVRERPAVTRHGATPLAYVTDALARGRSVGEFGLPPDPDDPSRPCAAIRRAVSPTVAFVDTENVRMAFSKHADYLASLGEPGRALLQESYPEGWDAALRGGTREWIDGVRTARGLGADDVWLIGRSTALIDQTVGADYPGRRIFLPAELREKVRRTGDSTDDSLLAANAAHWAAEHPLGHILVMTGDMDIPLVLRETLRSMDAVTVYAPWTVSKELHKALKGRHFVEGTFPAPLPPTPKDWPRNKRRRNGV